MNVRVVKTEMGKLRADLVAAGVFEDEPRMSEAAKALDHVTGGRVADALKDFSAKLHVPWLISVPGTCAVKRVLLVGLGKHAGFTREKLCGAAARAAQKAREIRMKRVVLPLQFAGEDDLSLRERIEALVIGSQTGLYRFDEYKTAAADRDTPIAVDLTLLAAGDDTLKDARKAAADARVIADSVCFARDLVNQPANRATPSFIAQAARRIAREHDSVSCSVFDAKKAQKLGMGAFLGVARGSDEPARFIALQHRGAGNKKTPAVVLVGKAVTFDSGGISLKPPQNMEEMKTDMAGGAAVMGALKAAAGLNLPLHVVGLIPAVENLPSGRALKPGDIVRAMSGKTIEIISTDAEGRLILADALCYAQRYKPAAVIDIATLTGSCVIALGHEASAVLGTDEQLIGRIRKAGDGTAERVWQLPLYEEYAELIKSDAADMKNVGGRPAGTITAACFLREFAGKFPWAHIDIAGTAWAKKEKPCVPRGATGVGVRLLLEVLRSWRDT